MASPDPDSEPCVHCGGTDYQAGGFGPRTLVLCTACGDVGAHVECEAAALGVDLDEDMVDAAWFCGEECQKVHTTLADAARTRIPLEGGYTLELVDPSASGGGRGGAVDAALKLFRSAFAPLVLESGADLVDLVTRATVGPDGDYSGFKVALLRGGGGGGAPLCAAAVCAHGPRVAELPFLATRDGARRQGHARRLLATLEALLTAAGVRQLVVPAAKPLKTMWTKHLGYAPLSLQERAALAGKLVEVDAGSAVVVGKWLAGGAPPPKKKAPAPKPAAPPKPATNRRGGSARAAAVAATATVKRVVAPDDGDADGDKDFAPDDQGGGSETEAPPPRRRRRAAAGSRAGRARPASSKPVTASRGTVTLSLLVAALAEAGAAVKADADAVAAARLAEAAAKSQAAGLTAAVKAALDAMAAGDGEGARAALEGVVVSGGVVEA